MRTQLHPALFAVALSFLAAWSSPAGADGMIPATTVVIVNEDEGEATMQVTNSDNHLSLLHVSLLDIPEDNEPLLLVTPPLARVEGGKSQTVRFILQDRTGQAPLTTQRMKRVIFEGIPESRAQGDVDAKVALTFRQNLPVIIHPKGLAVNRTPWEGLKWSVENGELVVNNATKYVVRLSQSTKLLPGTAEAALPKAYLLPGETLRAPITGTFTNASSVSLQPATVYGYAVGAYQAPLVIR